MKAIGSFHSEMSIKDAKGLQRGYGLGVPFFQYSLVSQWQENEIG